jgi:hypothetical protein
MKIPLLPLSREACSSIALANVKGKKSNIAYFNHLTNQGGVGTLIS